jgi:predicted Zn-dependent protease
MHIAERGRVANRPEWENPSFYLVLIGDLELGRDRVDQALENYVEADAAKVDEALVSDRIRSVAKWYEDRQRFGEAFALLQKYRLRDPLLFDPTLDRLGKKITELEEKTREVKSQ